MAWSNLPPVLSPLEKHMFSLETRTLTFWILLSSCSESSYHPGKGILKWVEGWTGAISWLLRGLPLPLTDTAHGTKHKATLFCPPPSPGGKWNPFPFVSWNFLKVGSWRDEVWLAFPPVPLPFSLLNLRFWCFLVQRGGKKQRSERQERCFFMLLGLLDL